MDITNWAATHYFVCTLQCSLFSLDHKQLILTTTDNKPTQNTRYCIAHTQTIDWLILLCLINEEENCQCNANVEWKKKPQNCTLCTSIDTYRHTHTHRMEKLTDWLLGIFSHLYFTLLLCRKRISFMPLKLQTDFACYSFFFKFPIIMLCVWMTV